MKASYKEPPLIKTIDGKDYRLHGGKHETRQKAEKVADRARRGADINGRPHYVRIIKDDVPTYKYMSLRPHIYYYVYVREKPSKYIPLSERVRQMEERKRR